MMFQSRRSSYGSPSTPVAVQSCDCTGLPGESKVSYLRDEPARLPLESCRVNVSRAERGWRAECATVSGVPSALARLVTRWQHTPQGAEGGTATIQALARYRARAKPANPTPPPAHRRSLQFLRAQHQQLLRELRGQQRQAHVAQRAALERHGYICGIHVLRKEECRCRGEEGGKFHSCAALVDAGHLVCEYQLHAAVERREHLRRSAGGCAPSKRVLASNYSHPQPIVHAC